jgi:rhamnosyltransferase
MKFLAGVVLYNPPSSTISLLKALRSQGCVVHVFINALPADQDICAYADLSDYMSFKGENLGLARALNAIIDVFKASTSQYLFLFDQDSRISDDYIDSMINEYQSILSVDHSIACLAPMLVDIKDRSRSAKNGILGSSQTINTAQAHPTAATSGCLFTQKSFSTVGVMDENLFIDGIDHDWCLRAWMSKSSIYFSNKVTLSHNMGDSFIKYGTLLKPIHSNPIRHYYIVRNSIYMILWKSFPAGWNLLEGFKTIRRVIGYPLLSEKHFLSFRMVILGILHGIFRQMGKLPSHNH